MYLSSNKIKENFSYKEVESIINRINDLKILIIGDTIIDEYNYVSFLGKPSNSKSSGLRAMFFSILLRITVVSIPCGSATTHFRRVKGWLVKFRVIVPLLI